MTRGKAFVFISPSGGGKSTLLKKLRADFPQFKESISCTTRSPRAGEQHGVQYFFIAKEDFEQKIARGDFIEWAKVHENYYGTSKEFVETELRNGSIVLLDIDVQGADAVKRIFGADAHAIFIAPPSFDVLEARLRARGTDSEETIAVRLKNAKGEMARQNDYDYCLINDDLESAYKKLRAQVEKVIAG